MGNLMPELLSINAPATTNGNVIPLKAIHECGQYGRSSHSRIALTTWFNAEGGIPT